MKKEKFFVGLLLISGLVISDAAQAQSADLSYFEQIKALRSLAKNESKPCAIKTLEKLARAADKNASAEDRFFEALESCAEAKGEYLGELEAILYPDDEELPDEEFPDDGGEDF